MRTFMQMIDDAVLSSHFLRVLLLHSGLGGRGGAGAYSSPPAATQSVSNLLVCILYRQSIWRK